MNRNLIKSSFVLLASGVICKILGAFFRLPLTNILGVEGIGTFQMVMSLYIFALVFCSGGVNIAVSRLVSSYRSKNQQGKISSLFKKGILWCLGTGVLVGFVFLLFAEKIALFQNCPSAQTSYYLMLALLPLGGIIACFRGLCQGFENMLPTAISQIIEQSIRFCLGLVFAYLFLQKNTAFGVMGAFFGVLIGEVISFLYLLVYIKKYKISGKSNQKTEFFKNNFVLTFSNAVFPFVGAVESFIIINRLCQSGFLSEQATMLFGICTGIVGAILHFPLIISSSISTVILPSLSFFANNKEETKEKINNSLKILTFLIFPTVLGVVAICSPLYQLIFPTLNYEMLQYAVTLTQLGGISVIFSAFVQFFVAILQARGKLLQTLAIQTFAGVVKIFLVFTLCSLPSFNIFGLAISNIFMSGLIVATSVILLQKYLKISLFDFSLPVLSSMIMFAGVRWFLSRCNLGLIFQILISASFGILIYFVLTLPIIFPYIKNFIAKKQQNTEKV